MEQSVDDEESTTSKLVVAEASLRSSFLRSMHRQIRKRLRRFKQYPHLAAYYFSLNIDQSPLVVRLPKPQPRVFAVDTSVESPHGVGRVVKLLKNGIYVIMTSSGSHNVCHDDLRRSTRPPASIAYEVGDLVEVARRTWPGINKQGGTARIKTKREDGKYDVVFTLTNNQERGLDAIYLQPAVFRSRNDKRDVSGRCRVPNCPSFIRDCRHVQPDEFADILTEKIEKKNKQKEKTEKTSPPACAPIKAKKSTDKAAKHRKTVPSRKRGEDIRSSNISETCNSNIRSNASVLPTDAIIPVVRSVSASSLRSMSMSQLLNEMKSCTEILTEATNKSRLLAEEVERKLLSGWPDSNCEHQAVFTEYEAMKNDYEAMRLQTEWNGVDAFNYVFSLVRKRKTQLTAHEKMQRSLLDLQHTALNVEWREVDAATIRLLIRLRDKMRERFKDIDFANDEEDDDECIYPFAVPHRVNNRRSTAPSYENRYAGDRIAGAKRKHDAFYLDEKISTRRAGPARSATRIDQANNAIRKPSTHSASEADEFNHLIVEHHEDVNDFIASDDDFEHWVNNRSVVRVSMEEVLPERAANTFMEVLADDNSFHTSHRFQYEHESSVQFDHDMEIVERMAEAKIFCKSVDMTPCEYVVQDLTRDLYSMEISDATVRSMEYHYDLLESLWVNNAMGDIVMVKKFVAECISLILKFAMRNFLVNKTHRGGDILFYTLTRIVSWIQLIDQNTSKEHQSIVGACVQLMWSFACGSAMTESSQLLAYIASTSSARTTTSMPLVTLWMRLTSLALKEDGGESSWQYFSSSFYECTAWKYASSDRMDHPAFNRAKNILSLIAKTSCFASVQTPFSSIAPSVVQSVACEKYLSGSLWTLIAFHNYALRVVATKDETLPTRIRGSWQMIEFIVTRITDLNGSSQWLHRTALLSSLWENVNKPMDIFISVMSRLAVSCKWPQLIKEHRELNEQIESELVRLLNREHQADIVQHWMNKQLFLSHQLVPLVMSDLITVDAPSILSRTECLASFLGAFRNLLRNCLQDVSVGSVQHRRLKLRLNAGNGLMSICPANSNFISRILLLYCIHECASHFDLESFMSVDAFTKLDLLMCCDDNILCMSSDECSCLQWVFVSKVIMPLLSTSKGVNDKIISLCLHRIRSLWTEVHRNVVDEVSCLLVPSSRTRTLWMFLLQCTSSLIARLKSHHVLFLQDMWYLVFPMLEYQLDKQIGHSEGVFSRLSLRILDDSAALFLTCLRDKNLDSRAKLPAIKSLTGQIQRLLTLVRRSLNDAIDLINEDVLVSSTQPAWSVSMQITRIYGFTIKLLHDMEVDDTESTNRRDVKLSWMVQLSSAMEVMGQIPCIQETAIDSWLKCALWTQVLHETFSLELFLCLKLDHVCSMINVWIGCVLSAILQPQVLVEVRLAELEQFIFSERVLQLVSTKAPHLFLTLDTCRNLLPVIDHTCSRFEQSIASNEQQCLSLIRKYLLVSAMSTFTGYKLGDIMLQDAYNTFSRNVCRVLRFFQSVCNKLSASTRASMQRIIQEITSNLCGPFLFACSSNIAIEIYDALVLPVVQTLTNYAISSQRRGYNALLHHDLPENGQNLLLHLSMYMRGIALTRFSTRFTCWTSIINLAIVSRRSYSTFRENIIKTIAESLLPPYLSFSDPVYPCDFCEGKKPMLTSYNLHDEGDAFLNHQCICLRELAKYILNDDKLWHVDDNQSSANSARVDLIAYYTSIPVVNSVCSGYNSIENAICVDISMGLTQLIAVNAIYYVRLLRLYMGDAFVNIFGYHEKEEQVTHSFQKCVYCIVGTNVTISTHLRDAPTFVAWRSFARAACSHLRYIEKMTVVDALRLVRVGKELLQSACLCAGCDCITEKRFGHACRAGYMYDHLKEHLSFAKDKVKHLEQSHDLVQVRKFSNSWLAQQLDNIRIALAPNSV